MAKKKTKIDKSLRAKDETLLEALKQFVEYHPPQRMSRNLRKMLIEFLQHDGAIEAMYLNDLLYDLEGFFQLLDVTIDKDE